MANLSTITCIVIMTKQIKKIIICLMTNLGGIMAIRIVMGTAYSGKSYFAKTHFPEALKLDIYEYQKQVKSEGGLLDSFATLYEANERIKKDLVNAVAEHKDVVMEHTLFKCKRRIVYVDAVREVSEEPIEIYLMRPSEDRLKANILERDGDKDDNDDFLKRLISLQKEIEMPNPAEGFSKIFIVKDGVIEEYVAPADDEMVSRAREELRVENEQLKLQRERQEAQLREEQERKAKLQVAIEKTKTAPFWHYCDGCGKKELLTSKEAFENGWDYPGVDGIYKSRRNYGFGCMAPRTCGNCGIDTSLYWKLMNGENIGDEGNAAIERIKNEPMSLME